MEVFCFVLFFKVVNMYDVVKYAHSGANVIFTRGQFWLSGIVIACVCLYICPFINT